jgi:hypothetical protein
MPVVAETQVCYLFLFDVLYISGRPKGYHGRTFRYFSKAGLIFRILFFAE